MSCVYLTWFCPVLNYYMMMLNVAGGGRSESEGPTADSVSRETVPISMSLSSSTLLMFSVHLYGHHWGLPSFVQHSLMQVTWKTWEHSSAISSSVRWFIFFWQMQHWGKSLSSGWTFAVPLRSWQTFPQWLKCQTQPNMKCWEWKLAWPKQIEISTMAVLPKISN